MNKYQYDDEYFIAVNAGIFLSFQDYEEEEAFLHALHNGKY